MKAATALAQMASKMKRPLVFTNGVFRTFHAGHLECVIAAYRQGESLIVGINSDVSLLALGRPSVQTEDQRLNVVQAVLDGMPAYDERPPMACLFNEPTPIKLIKALRPDVLVKGGDYAGQEIVGADFVRSYGGRVHFTKYIEGLSATRLLGQ